LQGLEGRKNVA